MEALALRLAVEFHNLDFPFFLFSFSVGKQSRLMYEELMGGYSYIYIYMRCRERERGVIDWCRGRRCKNRRAV